MIEGPTSGWRARRVPWTPVTQKRPPGEVKTGMSTGMNGTTRVVVGANHPVVWQSIVHVLKSKQTLDVSGRSFDDLTTDCRIEADVILCVIDPRSEVEFTIEDLLLDIQHACPTGWIVCL